MTEPNRFSDLYHTLVNPLAALLSEVQLTLTSGVAFDDETRQSLQQIEKLALRMTAILKATRSSGAPPVSPGQETP